MIKAKFFWTVHRVFQSYATGILLHQTDKGHLFGYKRTGGCLVFIQIYQ